MSRPKADVILETKVVPLKELRPYPGNARIHDDDLIEESIKAHGQYRALVVQKSTGHVLAGNGTYHALMATGHTEALAHMVEVDDEEAKRINLVDNRTQDRGRYDEGLLADLLQSLPTLDGTGYDSGDLDELLSKLNPSQGLTDPDDVPAPPEEAFTKPGDLWLLGEHRLLCGDATKRGDVERLIPSGRGGLLMTDPPYGVDYSMIVESRANQKRGGWKPIANDTVGVGELRPLLTEAFGVAVSALREDAAWFVWHPSGDNVAIFRDAMEGVGIGIHKAIVWE